MHDPQVVRFADRVTGLNYDVDLVRQREHTRTKSRREIRARQAFHDEIRRAIAQPSRLEKAHGVLASKGSRQPRLSEHPTDRPWTEGIRVSEEFDRDEPALASVERFEDNPHAAGSQYAPRLEPRRQFGRASGQFFARAPGTCEPRVTFAHPLAYM